MSQGKDRVPAWCRDSKTSFKKSRKEEKRVAGEFGGKALPRSGARRLAPTTIGAITQSGDLQTDAFLGEHKRTRKREMNVQSEWFLKVSEGARMALRLPAVILLFETVDGRPREWIFLPKRAFSRRIPLNDAAFQIETYTARAGSFTLTVDRVRAMVRGAQEASLIPRFDLEWAAVLGACRWWCGIPTIDSLPYLREDAGHVGTATFIQGSVLPGSSREPHSATAEDVPGASPDPGASGHSA